MTDTPRKRMSVEGICAIVALSVSVFSGMVAFVVKEAQGQSQTASAIDDLRADLDRGHKSQSSDYLDLVGRIDGVQVQVSTLSNTTIKWHTDMGKWIEQLRKDNPKENVPYRDESQNTDDNSTASMIPTAHQVPTENQ